MGAHIGSSWIAKAFDTVAFTAAVLGDSPVMSGTRTKMSRGMPSFRGHILEGIGHATKSATSMNIEYCALSNFATIHHKYADSTADANASAIRLNLNDDVDYTQKKRVFSLVVLILTTSNGDFLDANCCLL